MRVSDVRSRLSSAISRELRRQSPLDDKRFQEGYDNRVSSEFIEGNHIQEPWIERLPMYKAFEQGLEGMKGVIEQDQQWINFIDFLIELRDSEDTNQIFNPYSHQQDAVKNWWEGRDVVVSTGTGSGKTECFLWPIIGHLWKSRVRNQSQKRGVKAIVLYPMNALATDQLKRVRKIFGDDEIAEKLSGRDSDESMNRLFQFMLYTGRTYNHGPYSELKNKEIAKPSFSKYLLKNGKVKNVMDTYLNLQNNEFSGYTNSEGLFLQLYENGFLPRTGQPQTNEDGKKYRDYGGRFEQNRLTTITEHDTELVFRHEAHNVGYKNRKTDGTVVDTVKSHHGGTPDLLITNYSMLDFMINRPLEDCIWEDTKSWLNEHDDNKLLFILDEAHLYDGMKGLQISHLLRRLFLTLELTHESVEKKIQFILTSASLGESGPSKQKSDFYKSLTSRGDDDNVHFCDGEEWEPVSSVNYFDELITEGLVNELSRRGDISYSIDEFRENLIQQLNDFSSKNHSELEWFNIIRESNFFREFYQNTKSPIPLSELEGRMFSDVDEDCLSSQFILDLLTSLRGPHPGTSQISPMVSIRSHILTRGLPKLHLQISGNEWKILDGPNPIISWEDSNYSMNPLLLLGCRSCGSTYVRIWIRMNHVFYDENDAGQSLRDGINNHWVKNQIINGGNWLEGINYETTDELTQTYGFDIHLLDNNDGIFSIIGAGNTDEINTSTVYGRNTVHGWLNSETCQIFPPWYIQINNEHNLIPFVFATKSEFRDELVDYSNQTGAVDEISEGALFTFNHGGFCLRCRRNYSRQSGIDQIVNYQTRGDNIFAYLTTELIDLQKSNPKVRQPNAGRKVLAFSDSVGRASNLARELQRLSNADEFRKILISLLRHPWYLNLRNDDFDDHKNLSKLYYHFVLYSSALGKEPIEHLPGKTDSGTFSSHRAEIIAAHLLCLDDPEDKIKSKHLDGLIDSIVEKNSGSFSIKDRLKNLKQEMFDTPDSDILDEIFVQWYRTSFLEDFTNAETARLWRNNENNHRSNRITQLANSLTTVTRVYKQEFNHVFTKVREDLKGDNDGWPLTEARMLNRFIRCYVSDEINVDENREILEVIQGKLFSTPAPNREHRVLARFLEIFKNDKFDADGYAEIKERRAPQLKLSRELKNYDALILSDVARALIEFYVNFDDEKLNELFLQIEYFTTPEFIRPSTSFIGQITRIISDKFLSIDQLGMGYVEFTPKAKFRIQQNLKYIWDTNKKTSPERRSMRNIGLDFDDETSVQLFFNDFYRVLDGVAQAMVRQGSRVTAASSFSLYSRESGFTLEKMKERMPFLKHATDLDKFKEIFQRINPGENYDNFINTCLGINPSDSPIFRNSSEILGTSNPDLYTIGPEHLMIKAYDSPNSIHDLLICPICARPHPHPRDVELNLCRWCDNVQLRQFDTNNPVDEQRIYRPWLQPLEKLNLGEVELPTSGLRIIRAEEHTSQIGSHIREGELLSSAIKFELLFQDIPFVMPRPDGGVSDPEPMIDILSSTTTMEVGIDIGDLTAVALRTIPRNASNYQQRVGRAGRKASEVCVALSWFDQSQYAQSHYNEPKKLLLHSKNPPLTYKFNEHVTKQHLCFAILGQFTKRHPYDEQTRMRVGLDPKANLMESHGSIVNFFTKDEDNDEQQIRAGNTFEAFEYWIENDLDKEKLLIIFPKDFKSYRGKSREDIIKEAIIQLKEALTNLGGKISD